MDNLGRNPNDEHSGEKWREAMSRLKGAYTGLPPANCPANAKLHRQAALKGTESESHRNGLMKIYRELNLDF